jgi:hypothetical protein
VLPVKNLLFKLQIFGNAEEHRLPLGSNDTDALSVVVWRRPHDARFLYASKENEQTG